MRIWLFYGFAIAIWVASHLYVARRLSASVDRDSRWRHFVWGAIAMLAVVPVLVFAANRLGFVPRTSLILMGYAPMGASSILVIFVMFGDVMRLGDRAYRRVRGKDLPSPERRAFLGRMANAVALGGAGGLSVLGYGEAVRLPRLEEVDVPVPDLPEALEGFRVVQITDVHVGGGTDRAYLEGVVGIANGAGADLIAVTGDLVDGYVGELLSSIEPLSELRARHGAYFVTGNHEYFWDGPAWCEAVGGLGLTVLNNAHRVLEHDGAHLVVAGITDRTGHRVPGHRSDPTAAVAGAPPGIPVLMLAHQPRSAPDVAETGAQIMICGHTHGGQYFPVTLFARLVQPYVAGLHLLRDTWIYVSRGAGYWGPPNRLGSPSEITLLRLRRA